MASKFKLDRENLGFITALIFYAAAGIVCFIFLPLANYPPHIGIIGIFSLLTAYGFFKKRVWTIWLVVMLFFIVTTFSLWMLYSYFGANLLLDISMVAYLILTWIFTAYTAAKRKMFET